MKLLLALLLPLSALAQTRITNAKFINVNTGKIEENKTILVKQSGGRRTIDAKGAYVLPALYDMHVHAPDTLMGSFFGLVQQAGIYKVRIMKASAAQALSIRTQSGPTETDLCFNVYASDTTRPQNIAAMVRGLRKKGYDFIKCFSVPRKGWFDTLMQAAKAADMRVCGHSLGNVPALHALQSGYKSIEHLGYFDKASSTGLDSLLLQAKASGTYLCPTLDWSMMVYHTVPKDSALMRAGAAAGVAVYGPIWEKAYAATETALGANKQRYSAYFREQLQIKLQVLRKARALGIPIIAGSDAEEPYQTPGYSLVEELKWIAMAGFSNAELLQMVTTNAMAYYRQATPSAYILLEKNPLENIHYLSTVKQMVQ